MDYTYKVIFFNKKFYKELELPQNKGHIRVGTIPCCDLRLWEKLLHTPLCLDLTWSGRCWVISCTEDLYFDAGGSGKLVSFSLLRPCSLVLRYRKSGGIVLNIEIQTAFDHSKCRYSRVISVLNDRRITIGSALTADIVLESAYAQEEYVSVEKTSAGRVLRIINTKFCIYHNGARAADREIIENGDFLFIADYCFYFKDSTIRTESRQDMRINGYEYLDLPEDHFNHSFEKITRIRPALTGGEIQILDPPPIPRKQEGNLILRLLPSMGMLAAAAVMALIGSGMMLIFSGVSAGTGILAAAAGVYRGKKKYKKECADRQNIYRKYISGKISEIEERRRTELCRLNDIYRPVDELIRMMKEFSRELFDRSAGDEDFLDVRIGTGKVPAGWKVVYKHQERLETEDEMQLIPEKISAEYKYIPESPVCVRLRDINALGICGDESDRCSMLKIIMLDIAARHSPEDVKMVFAASTENAGRIIRYRMLPHVMLEDNKIRGIVIDEPGRKHIFEYLYKELSAREQKHYYTCRIVVFLYDECGFKNHPLSRFTGKAKDLGVTFICFCSSAQNLIPGCDYCIELTDTGERKLVRTSDSSLSTDFDFCQVDDDEAVQAVMAIAPMRKNEISLAQNLETSLSLFQLMNIYSVRDLDPASQWGKADISETMAAPVGRSKDGTVFLDIHDSKMGPHGLIAGTTGSGKSEFLQTYVLSAAAAYHPHEVQFLLIDFKGGGMAAQLAGLPHISGVITNLDGRSIRRSLKTIRAELLKRQRLFEDRHINHIDKYIRQSRECKDMVPLAHLIIIVDEFAELKSQYPEFMKELISAARIGRSLGVHLILATQKPSGQVDEQIWSNSGFRICLKVQNANDSNEVLRSPLASEIREPGRAYLQVGNNEIFELFQSAYGGVSEHREEAGVGNFCIYELSASGERKKVYEKEEFVPDKESLTQAEALVRHIKEFCASADIRPLPAIFMPPLEDVVDFPETQAGDICDHAYRNEVTPSGPDICDHAFRNEVMPSGPGIWTDIGIYDDPDNQYQGSCLINLAQNNLMIIGPSGCGKTNLLRTIIRSAASKYTPEEINIYIIDFASSELREFESLNHVGGVVCPGDDEKIKNLFRMLTQSVKIRKVCKNSPAKTFPHILLVIDNLTALKEIYLEEDQELLSLCRDGPGVGMSVIVSNQRASGIGYRYLADFHARTAFHCFDNSEYGYIFGRIDEEPADIPGRCLAETGSGRHECQVYRAFSGNDSELHYGIEAFISAINSSNTGSYARRIPSVPDIFTKEDAWKLGKTDETLHHCRRFSVIAGIDYSTVEPFECDMAEAGTLAVIGTKEGSSYRWLRYVIESIRRQAGNSMIVFAVDGISRNLGWLHSVLPDASLSILPDDILIYITEIHGILKSRYEEVSRGNPEVLEKAPLVMLLVDSMDAICDICSDPAAMDAYRDITGKYKNMNVCVIVSCMENAGVSYNAPEILKNIRDERHYLYFDDISSLRLFDPPVSMIREFKKPISSGDAFYFRNNKCIKIRTPV